MFSRMVKYRQLQLTYIDARVKLLSEVVGSIRSVKVYAYTKLFGHRVEKLRVDELKKLKVNGFNRATMNATMVFIPTLAAVCELVGTARGNCQSDASDVHHVRLDGASSGCRDHLYRLAVLQRPQNTDCVSTDVFHCSEVSRLPGL